MSITPRVFGFSHIGHRNENQDRFHIFDMWKEGKSLLIVIADGMGGHIGGSIASEAVISTTRKLWTQRNQFNTMQAFLNSLAERAQAAVLQAGQQHNLEPHTTIAAFYLKDQSAFSMHAGDSRIMQYSGTTFVRRTHDHSLAEILFQNGIIHETEIATHPDQNKLTKCLGSVNFNSPEICTWDISTPCSFVICTDGFWALWPKEQIGKLINQLNTPEDIEQHVSVALKSHTGHDNTTAVILHVNPDHLSA